MQRCRFAGILTYRQVEILRDLDGLAKQSGTSYFKPKELGAERNSHHAFTLKTLTEAGYVQRTALNTLLRPPYAYQITEKGIEALQTLRELSDVPLHSILGGKADKARAKSAIVALTPPRYKRAA